MATLHQATESTKQVFKWGIIGITVLFLLTSMWKVTVAVKERFFPSKPPAPTVTFGQLPALTLPESVTKNNFTYSIDTIDGSLDTLPDRVTIYKTVVDQPNLLNTDRIRRSVLNNGFGPQPHILTEEKKRSDIEYEWDVHDEFDRKLVVNTIDNDFTLQTTFLNNANVLGAAHVPSQVDASRFAQAFLSGITKFPTDIDLNKTYTELLDIRNGRLVAAPSLSNAQLLRVNFYQNDIDKLPIYYATPPGSSMNFLIGSGAKDIEMLQATYNHQYVITDGDSGTYPIKTSQEAYQELTSGGGYIASVDSNIKNVHIKAVKLGYYLGLPKQQYVMPVIVFEGDNDFYGYVSAIRDEWIIPK